MKVRKKLKRHLLNLSKKNVQFRKVLRKSLRLYRSIKYSIVSDKGQINNKMIIFEAYMGRSYADSPRALYEYMVNNKKYNDFKFIWAFKNPDEKAHLFTNENTILVKYGSKDYYKYYSISKYWISNSRIPEQIKKKKGQVYIQTWHGTPLKRLGYDIKVTGGNALNSNREIRAKYDDDALRYDYMLSPSKFCTEKFISAFNLKKLNKENIIIEEGYPRNDFLFKYREKDLTKVKKELEIPKDKKVILYAPTWRDDQHVSGVGYTYELGINLNLLKEKLSKDYIILLRTHYFVSNSLDLEKYKDFVYDVSNYDDINDLYIISDLLITDYSSVFFDYANLNRPILFYMYDLDTYQNKLRDFYFDLKELPGPIIKNETGLIKEIRNIDKYFDKYNAKYVEFNNRFNYLDDGKSSKRVIERIIDEVKEKKEKPLLLNITKKSSFRNGKINFSAFGLFKILGSTSSNINAKNLKIVINDVTFPIKLKYEKGIPFIKGYYFNFYKFSLPIEAILNFDIQNKIKLQYKDNFGRILFNIFDFKNGKNRNSKIIIHNDSAIYFRQTIKNTMYLTIREKNVYDTFKGQLKIFFSYVLSKFWFKRNIILLYEKESNRYEESASVLYEKLIDKGYYSCYYIIDKNNDVLNNIDEKYKKNIIYKNSLRHLIYFFSCKKFIGTETIAHAIQLRIANKYAVRKINQKDISFIFLQHGVMYMISLDSDMRSSFRKNQYKLYKIVVSSKLEAEHFIELGGFNKKDLYITGLAKFDKSYKKTNADKIVIMPTWRRWELNQARIDFSKTNYYRMIEDIIKSIPEDLLQKTIILPHPLIVNYMKNSDCELKKYLPEKVEYDKILQNCKLLITDYSSISYDAFYRGSNVIFFWRDKDDCLKMYGEGTKLMLTKNLAFGSVCYNKKELVNAIQKDYHSNQETKYKNRYKKIVEFDDNSNSDRIISKLRKEKII